MAIDVFLDWESALAAVPRNDDGPVGRWLARRGLTAARRQLARGIGILHASVTWSTKTFEPNPDGEQLLVAPVWAGRAGLEHSDLMDLAAWRPGSPATIFLRLGLGTILGAGGVQQSLHTASPLRLHRDVEAFVRYGGERHGEYPAAMLLSPAHAYFHLGGAPTLIPDDVAHGRELRSYLEAGRPALPPIRIPVEAIAA